VKTILLVDGDSDSRIVYRTILRHHGFDVVEAADGQAGLELARKVVPALVITELTVPKLGGLDLIRQLRALPETHAALLLVLTAIALESERIRAEAAGCTKFLTKPIEPQVLLQEVRLLLS